MEHPVTSDYLPRRHKPLEKIFYSGRRILDEDHLTNQEIGRRIVAR